MIETLGREPHTTIRPISRQMRRQIERLAQKGLGYRCRRCPGLVDAATAVFDNDAVSHRACAERTNEMVAEINERAVRDRLTRAGLTLPGSR